MKLFEQFKMSKQLIEETEFVKIYTCLFEDKAYKIILTKKAANRHTIIHCQDEHITWQQVPTFFNWGGKMPGKTVPIYKFAQDKNHVIVFVIRGNPNGIIGLDDGIFRCANTFDDRYINVMRYSRFKKL